MKPETANALNELRKACAKKLGVNEDEVVMSVCQHTVPSIDTIIRLKKISNQIVNNTYDCPTHLHVVLANTAIKIDDLLDVEEEADIEAELKLLQKGLDAKILEVFDEKDYQVFLQRMREYQVSKHLFYQEDKDVQKLIILKEFYKKYNLPKLTLYEL